MTSPPLSLRLGLALAALWPGAAHAEFLPAALFQGLAASPDVSLSQQRLALAQARVRQDEGWQITASGNAALDGSLAGGVAGRAAWEASASLSAAYAGRTAISEAREGKLLALRRAEFQVRRALLAEVRRRTLAWHTLRLSQGGVQAADLAVQSARLALTSAEARAAQGTANASQVDAARLALERAQLAQRQAAQALEQARGELPVPALGGADSWAPLPVPPEGAAPGPREDVLEALLAVTEAELALARDRQSAQPTLALTGGLNTGSLNLSAEVTPALAAQLSATARLKPGPQTAASQTPISQTSWNLGLRGSFRLDGAAARVVQGAQATLAQARATLEATLARAGRDIAFKRRTLQGAQDSLSLAVRGLEAARQAQDTARTRLDLGLIGVSDELAARLEFARALEAQHSAERALDTATLDFWEALGWLPGAVQTTPQPIPPQPTSPQPSQQRNAP